MLRVTGKVVVVGGGAGPAGEVFTNREKAIQSGKLRRHETAAICGSTAQILVAFDTLLPSGKKIRAPFKSRDHGGRVSRAHGWYFLRFDIKKKNYSPHTKTRSQMRNTGGCAADKHTKGEGVGCMRK